MNKRVEHERVGILGGTFNPVHAGHLILAQDAMEAHDLSRVLFVPCARPAHKSERVLAEADHRWAMLERALSGDPRFQASRIELDRPGTSYAVDTVRLLRDAEPGVSWFFIIGADTLPELPSWKAITDLLKGCRFIAMRRPGQPERSDMKARILLPPPWPGRLVDDMFDGHLVDISSTDIRKRVAEKRSIRYLVPRDVETYIHDHRLYQTL